MKLIKHLFSSLFIAGAMLSTQVLAEEKTACRDQIQKKDRVKKKSYGVEL